MLDIISVFKIKKRVIGINGFISLKFAKYKNNGKARAWSNKLKKEMRNINVNGTKE